MDYIKIVASSFASIAALFLFTKIMGNREMSQLSMFDYVSSIALGSIAGEMAVMSTDSILEPLLSMGIFTTVTMFISYITCKSIMLRRFFEGQALVLYQKGQIYEKNLLKARIDIDEFLSVCRIEGYFDLEEVHTVFLEANGNVSILPLAKYRPMTPDDQNLNPQQLSPMANVIIDGVILDDNLLSTGKNKAWVDKQLKENNIKNMHEIILATYDSNKNKLNIYTKFHKKMVRDIFE
ncbi:MAG: hypothetical protein K0R00_1450 [Herbinix sp.]|jgi:uncharacterized membrane protein YcaP (DUF421 family)|nr:hypothetical protein [Herbinix sp.]